jgi:hypothetical protein
MTKIYESPDKGKTVYQREFGETEKTLYMENCKPVVEATKEEVKQDGDD